MTFLKKWSKIWVATKCCLFPNSHKIYLYQCVINDILWKINCTSEGHREGHSGVQNSNQTLVTSTEIPGRCQIIFFLSAQSILNGDIKKCNSMTDSSRNLVDSRRDIFGSLISPPEGWNLWLKKTRASHLAQLRVVNHQGETRGSKVNGSDPTLPSLSGFSLVYIWHKNQGFKIAFLQVPCDSSLDPDSTKGLISEAKKKRIFSWDDFQKLLLAAQISLWKCRTCWERQQHPPL